MVNVKVGASLGLCVFLEFGGSELGKVANILKDLDEAVFAEDLVVSGVLLDFSDQLSEHLMHLVTKRRGHLIY